MSRNRFTHSGIRYIRKIFQNSFFGFEFTFITQSSVLAPIIIFLLPPGGFFVFGMLIAAVNKLTGKKPAVEEFGCEHCPAAATCSMKKGGQEDA